MEQVFQVNCGFTDVELVGTENLVRTGETNLSNMIADFVYTEFEGTDLAFINSGNIRGNHVYPPGPLRNGDI